MKKCPTCEKTFDDAMRFCQIDGTPLVDEPDASGFDPYATIVGTPANLSTTPEPPAAPAAADATPSAAAISVPDEVLDLPDADPLKTVFVSDAEMKQVLGAEDEAAGTSEGAGADGPETAAKFELAPSMPEPPPPSFSDIAPPPSPFSEPPPARDDAVPAPPMFLEPEPAQPPPPPAPFQAPEPAAPMQEWAPPPPPDASWQNQQIGSNTPFQPPAAGAGGENKTLAIVSLVCGILSLVCCSWFIPGIAAIVMGFIARSKANSDPANYGGAGLALGGIITGAVSVVLGIIVVVLYLFGALAGALGNSF